MGFNPLWIKIIAQWAKTHWIFTLHIVNGFNIENRWYLYEIIQNKND
jgi:hypothetical protein